MLLYDLNLTELDTKLINIKKTGTQLLVRFDEIAKINPEIQMLLFISYIVR